MRVRRRPCRRERRSRAAVATATAALFVLLGALAGCDSADDADGGASPSARRPSPKPTFIWDRSPASIAAVGDSITRGFDACTVLADCPEVSWATGTDATVRSVAWRLLGEAGAVGRTWNHAKSGARIAELPEQMTRAVADKPELVTVMVGANDACRDNVSHMTSVADFRTYFETSVKKLRSELPKSQLYVSSVPDLKRLWSEGRVNALGKQIWKLGICQSMLGSPDAMDAAAVARRESVQERVVAYNKVLRDVCGRDARCRYDGGAVFEYRFSGDQLSHWDWFHPSKNGQQRLAEIAYRNITAKEPPA
ncbi:SGNH/GDSL hydrolase family protein [Streptomyces sp. ISL-100]|uniref:SGNH/GDSL hydrolase family protein n=1 Tax=Streptomyces sp. ISL-100 TaxID=2819173 RepID=UPI001BEB9027|nr:SGNH/GDSL hydrolase family protein [Streptomyces sp. ISL-100]MBT2398798.1 SGNH/GDSL hydrolase family protein [Streptomyces sp. ISL-100]